MGHVLLPSNQMGQSGKADKGVLWRFPSKSTGLSQLQVGRLIGQYPDIGKVCDWGVANRPTEAAPSPRRRGLRTNLGAGHGGGASPRVRALRPRAASSLADIFRETLIKSTLA